MDIENSTISKNYPGKSLKKVAVKLTRAIFDIIFTNRAIISNFKLKTIVSDKENSEIVF
jgi:hypothetical protein